MLHDVHFYQAEAKRNPNWMKPFLRPAAAVTLAQKMSFRKVNCLKEFLKAQGDKPFVTADVVEYFIACGWRVTMPKQNAANFLTDLAKAKKLVRVISGNARSKRYVARG